MAPGGANTAPNPGRRRRGWSGCARWTRIFSTSRAGAVIGEAPRERLVMLALDEADVTASNADATGGEPIFCDGGAWAA